MGFESPKQQPSSEEIKKIEQRIDSMINNYFITVLSDYTVNDIRKFMEKISNLEKELTGRNSNKNVREQVNGFKEIIEEELGSMGVNVNKERITFALENDYRILGLNRRTATIEGIKEKYRELSKRYHPDKEKVSESVDEKKFKQIKKAYENIKKEKNFK